MAKEILINVSEGEECRIALVEHGKLEELYMERTSSTSHVGNIYKGRVTNVEPSIQAAFVDFGLGRNGFLHISDLMPTYFGRKGEDIHETVGRKMARRDRPPIQRCLRRGDDIIVQIIKEGIGTKGPTLSTYLSIPGRILVMMPGMGKLGVSRKIEDEEERRRLRQILDSLKPPRDAGFIIRTAGIGKTKAEIQRDLTYLTRLWQNFQKKQASGPGPMELYTEGDLVTRTVRDVLTSDIDRITIDNKDVARRVKEFIKIAMPRTRNRVELYEEPVPLFHKYGIEREIELMYSRHVPLPSGGSLVIDSTEAIVAIDVNSGRFRDHSDAEMTAFKTDMEAADEIPRQLRLRDLGGVIICDFIDLRYERHRRDVEKRLHDNLRNDRAKTKMLRMSQFGIIEMTRQRMRPSLKRSIYSDCPHCKGAGLVKTSESMALDVMRRLAIAINDQRVGRIELAVAPEVAFYLNNRKRAGLAALENQWNKRILIRSDSTLAADAMNLVLYDGREGLVYLEELGMMPQPAMLPPIGQPQRGGRQQQRDRRDQRDQRHRDQRRPHRPEQRPAEVEEFDVDSVEDEVDRREEQIMEESSAGAETIAPRPAPVRAAPAAEAIEESSHEIAEAPADVDAPVFEEQQEEASSPRAEVARTETPSRGRRERSRRGRGRGGRGEQPSRAEHAAPAASKPQDELEETPVPADLEQPVQEPHPLSAEAPAQEPEPESPERQTEGGSGGRRRRRGGRGRGRGGRSSQAASAETAPQPRTTANVHEPEPRREPAPVAPRPAPEPVLVRTGSTDRHLMREEPILPPPVSRPRTYRDLDHIPDDLD